MKRFLCFACLAIYSLNLGAQPTAKNTATYSRLIASSAINYDGNTFVNGDSTQLAYSSNSGWDTVLNSWKYTTAEMYGYNNNSYDKFYRINRVHDNTDRIVSAKGEVWDANNVTWQTEAMDYYHYNSANTIDVEVTAHFNGTYWDSAKVINNYDGSGLLINSLTQKWSSILSLWEDYSGTTNTYVGNNLQKVVKEKKNSFAWVNDELTTNTYNANNDITVSITQKWTGAGWDNSFMYNHIYNGNNERDTTLKRVFINNNYVNQYQITRTFNSYNQVKTESRKSWNVTLGQFEYMQGDRIEHFYYENYTTSVNTTQLSSGTYVLHVCSPYFNTVKTITIVK